MKLDKRILPGKRPLGCFDTEAAQEFVNKEGYFCRAEYLFSDAKKIGSTSVLAQIKPKDPAPFIPWNLPCAYEYFLPAEWLKPEEPEIKWRPFSLAEWIEQHEIGEVIHYRSKSDGIELRHMYTGYAFGTGKDITKLNVGTLTLGVASYCFDYLFEDYEIEINNKWQSFGVEDAE